MCFSNSLKPIIYTAASFLVFLAMLLATSYTLFAQTPTIPYDLPQTLHKDWEEIYVLDGNGDTTQYFLSFKTGNPNEIAVRSFTYYLNKFYTWRLYKLYMTGDRIDSVNTYKGEEPPIPAPLHEKTTYSYDSNDRLIEKHYWNISSSDVDEEHNRYYYNQKGEDSLVIFYSVFGSQLTNPFTSHTYTFRRKKYNSAGRIDTTFFDTFCCDLNPDFDTTTPKSQIILYHKHHGLIDSVFIVGNDSLPTGTIEYNQDELVTSITEFRHQPWKEFSHLPIKEHVGYHPRTTDITYDTFNRPRLITESSNVSLFESVTFVYPNSTEYTPTFNPYPNPTLGQLVVPAKRGHFKVYNFQGKPVQILVMRSEANKTLINTTPWEPGIYYIQITNLTDPVMFPIFKSY